MLVKAKENFADNHFLHILRLFNILQIFLSTTIETMRNYYV